MTSKEPIHIDASKFKDADWRVTLRRERAVSALVDEAHKQGNEADPVALGMKYDFELAPFTTNRKQLDERGVVVPDPQDVPDRELAYQIMRLAVALSYLGIYLTHTDHLDDRTLYTRLCNDILDEDIREMPPTDVAAEFIDLVGSHPAAEEIHFSYYATDDERKRFGKDHYPKRTGHGRDRTLPHPHYQDRELGNFVVIVNGKPVAASGGAE